MEATLTKVTLPTAVLQDLVARAAKGSTNVDIIPLSCLMQLKIENNVLSVKTTNNVNFVTVKANVEAPDFEIVVQTKLFAALVAKLASASASIIVDGNKITVEAGGKYNIPLALDTDGSKIEFPSPVYEPVGGSKTLTNEEIRSILSISKACKAEMKEIPSIYNYYFDNNNVITTNVFKGCINPISAFETPVVLSPELVDLITVVQSDDEPVTVSQNEDSVQFITSKGEVYGKKCTPADLESFPADQLIEASATQITNVVKLNRTTLASAVDRLCLFTDQLESNRLEVTFTPNGVNLYSASTDSNEVVTYVPGSNPVTADVTLQIDAKMLAQELAAAGAEELTVKFDSNAGIIFNVGKTIVLLSVLEDVVEA